MLAVAALAVGLFVYSGAAAGATVAPGSPGAESYFDLARKDCVGTARNTTSKVWFTVADGVLSDVYWPTVDATNVHTLQYLVSDGHSFTDLQTRDMTYRVLPDPTGMACTVIATSAAHHYRIRTTYLTDPSRDTVLMRTRFQGPAADKLYVRLDPLAGGTGGGGSQNAGPNTAWSERLEAQGFAPVVWVDPSGASLGSGQLVVDQSSQTATLVVPLAAFGKVRSGWVFTVTLTGQDGFSSDQARAFTATPGAFTFGVCSAGESSPICSVNPNTVPKVLDTIPPPGVTQDTELDPTLRPVVIQGVTVP